MFFSRIFAFYDMQAEGEAQQLQGLKAPQGLAHEP